MSRVPGLSAALLAALAGALTLMGCGALTGGGTEEGSVVLSLTDSPVLADDVARAVITISGIEYSLSADTAGAGATWLELVSYDTPREFDLLSLQGGTVAELADVTLPAGHIGQIRFILDAPEVVTGGAAPSTSGCYIELADSTQLPLFVPSGSSSGFKATGAFDVPVNGTVEITADFDVRKSIVQRGSLDSYLLKPTIRLVVNDEAGGLNVTLANDGAYTTLAVFAYEDGTYDNAEAELPASEADDPQFANAVTSAIASADGAYRLAFLAAGTYDLVVAAYDADGVFEQVVTIYTGATVTSDHTTQLTIDLAP